MCAQEAARANISLLRDLFPGITEFGHDTSVYERNIEDEKVCSGEDFQELLKNGELSDDQLGILRQVEEELAQTSTFSRLFPRRNSDRWKLEQTMSVAFPDRECDSLSGQIPNLFF